MSLQNPKWINDLILIFSVSPNLENKWYYIRQNIIVNMKRLATNMLQCIVSCEGFAFILLPSQEQTYAPCTSANYQAEDSQSCRHCHSWVMVTAAVDDKVIYMYGACFFLYSFRHFKGVCSPLDNTYSTNIKSIKIHQKLMRAKPSMVDPEQHWCQLHSPLTQTLRSEWVQYCKCIVSYDFLDDISFPLAYFIVRPQYIVHITCKISVNWLLMLSVRLSQQQALGR